VGLSQQSEPFFEVDCARGRRGRMLSRDGLMLHMSAVTDCARTPTPNFVPDVYLDEVCADTTVAAVELCLTGLWERVSDGYLVLDQEFVDQVVGFLEYCDRRAARRHRRRSA
jgi:hypothetical protein